MKQKIKMIVTDLDETLLRTDKLISENTKNVLLKCRQLGFKVVYATGRGGSAEHRISSEYFDGRIIFNGAIAKVNNDIVYKKLIPYKSARSLLIACDKYGLKTASQFNGMDYSNFNVTNEWSFIKDYKIVDFSKHELDAEKIYMVVKGAEDVKFIEKNLNSDIYLTVSKDNLGQVMHKDATKSKAIAALAIKWGIDASEIIAFGDDLNDIDMLNYAGVSVAVENALPEVKAVANYTCQSNNEDGVANWLLNNLL